MRAERAKYIYIYMHGEANSYFEAREGEKKQQHDYGKRDWKTERDRQILRGTRKRGE